LAIQFDSTKNATDLVIKNGVEDDSYSIPEINQTVGTYELYLFAVKRKPGAGYITNKDVTDLRDDRRYCGYMSDGVRDGYAPSLMEYNNGEDFRFWVGTEEEYQQKKEDLPANTFCVITDGVTEDEILEDIETVKQTLLEEINAKAPGNYGLGNAVKKQWSEINNITAPGWYKFEGNISIAGIPYKYAYMRVDSYSDTQATQFIYPVSNSSEQKILVRSKQGSNWSNTRIILTGTEYDQLYGQIEEEMSGRFDSVWGEINAIKGSGNFISSTYKKWSEVNTVTAPGWYRFNEQLTVGGVTANYAYMRVDSYNEKHACQILYLVYGDSDYEFRRRLYNGSWGDWKRVEYGKVVNNNTTVEYTEKFDGKTVYSGTCTDDTTHNGLENFSLRLTDMDNKIIRFIVTADFGIPGVMSGKTTLPFRRRGNNGEITNEIDVYIRDHYNEDDAAYYAHFYVGAGVKVHNIEIHYWYVKE
jgi:hypothetical protein